MRKFWRKSPPPALRVRLQHRDLDDAAVEGVWVGMFDGHYHLRAAQTQFSGDSRPFRHGEVLVPAGKVIFVEVLSRDYGSGPGDPGVGAA